VLSGEKDDWTRQAPCTAEVSRIKGSGQPAEQIIFEGAYHTLSTTGTVFNSKVMKTPEDFPQVYFSAIGNKPKNTRVAQAQDWLPLVKRVITSTGAAIPPDASLIPIIASCNGSGREILTAAVQIATSIK
jgi:hypothetical protein